MFGWCSPAETGQAVVAVLFLVIAPLIAFSIRRRWRQAEARREEVYRLLRLAAAEDARAETEAAIQYAYLQPHPAPVPAPAPSPDRSQPRASAAAEEAPRPMTCAVCFSPTKTRCSRCKAVRYCSGKCQIIHWREGHKDDCHPPQVNDHSDGSRDDEDLKGVSTDPSDLDNGLDIEGRLHTKLDETESIHPSSESNISSKFFSEDDSPGVKPLGSSSKTTATSDSYTDSSSSASQSSIADSSSSASFSPVTVLPSSDSFLAFTDSSPSASCSLVFDPSDTSHDAASCENHGVHHEGNMKMPSLNVVHPDSSLKGDDSTVIFTEVLPSKPATTGLPINDVSCMNKNKQKASVNKPDDFGYGLSNRFGSSGFSENYRSRSSISEKSGDAKPSQSSSKCQEPVDPSGVSSSGVLNITALQFSQKEDLVGLNAGSPSRISSNVPSSGSAPQQTNPNSRASCGGSPAEGSKLDVKRLITSSFDESAPVVKGRSSDILLRKPKDLSHQSSFSCGDQSHQTSPNHESHSITRYASSNMDNVPTVRSKVCDGTGSVTNGIHDLRTSVRRVVQQFKAAPSRRHYPPAFRNDISEKCKMLFPYDLFVKLYNCDKLELRPCGLVNCGNSCYANAVLQCLTFTRPLAAYLLQGLHSKACPKQEWCFTCELENLLMKAKGGQSSLSPIGILSRIQTIGSHLGYGREEDAHEFLRCAIDSMQSVCLKEAGAIAVGSLAEETTLIQMIFGGYLLSKIKCMRCRGKSERRERMMDLTVEIHGEIGTLEEALARFTATEILDGENKYRCDRCKSYERAKKKLIVLEAPNILTIALKRFQSGKFGKLNKAVRFPEYLNLAPYMSGTDDKSPVYRLYAVVVHLDIMNAAFSGHYVCYVKNTQKKWYKMDDCKVKPVELERVLSKNAYMLLYARCSPRAPSVIRSSVLHEPVKYKKNICKEGIQSGHSQEGHASRLRPNYPISHPGSSERRSQHDPYWSADQRTIFRTSNLLDDRYRFQHTDSSTDSSSLFSCSDEGSWSTESTRNSTSTEECAAYIFRDSDRFSFNSSSSFADDTDGTSDLHSAGQEDGSHAKGLSYEDLQPLEGGGSSAFLFSES